MITRIEDRRHAGRCLAQRFEPYADTPDVVVVGLPRGRVPVWFEIAKDLNVPLDIFIVRKLGVPIHEELAMGAIASGGVRVLNEEVIRSLGITPQMIKAAVAEQQLELDRREREYRGDRPPVKVGGHTAILVDDGLATGASMKAAVRALRQRHPKRIVVAVPVGAPETCALFEAEVEEVVCGIEPENFHAVGAWYEDFTQTTDQEVCELLDELAHLRKVKTVNDRIAIS